MTSLRSDCNHNNDKYVGIPPCTRSNSTHALVLLRAPLQACQPRA